MSIAPNLPVTVALIIVSGCVNRTRVEPTPELERSETAPTPDPYWRELANQQPPSFVPPDPPPVLTPPTEIPPAAETSPMGVLDDLPYLGGDFCYSYSAAPFCAHTKFDARGQIVWEIRIEYSDGWATAVGEIWSSGQRRFDRCWRDSQGRTIRHEYQSIHRLEGGCSQWTIDTRRIGYNEHGELLFSEETRGTAKWLYEEDTVVEIYQYVYENGHPVQRVRYYVPPDVSENEAEWWSHGYEWVGGRFTGGDLLDWNGHVPLKFSEIEVAWTNSYEWMDGRLARRDSFDRSGEWYGSSIFTWSGDLLRVDRFEPSTAAVLKTEIHQRRGPNYYVPLYKSPDTHWEYSTEDGIETVTKFVGELAVERRRFALVEGQRRPLTVEQLVPERVGLATVEQWNWSADRVIVERHDGRDVYLLDCSDLPPIESLIEPDCPPPRPIR